MNCSDHQPVLDYRKPMLKNLEPQNYILTPSQPNHITSGCTKIKNWTKHPQNGCILIKRWERGKEEGGGGKQRKGEKEGKVGEKKAGAFGQEEPEQKGRPKNRKEEKWGGKRPKRKEKTTGRKACAQERGQLVTLARAGPQGQCQHAQLRWLGD